MVLFADMKPDIQNQSSPRPTFSATAPGLPDCPPSNMEVDNFDITVATLPEKLGFSSEFQDDLKRLESTLTI